ncbi:hypothetical protein NTGHW29_300064 [Candidatus Nitrotoga sp. HW29]|nr:hypothetical protein NTGHW29_300064 [Candidatus Nitrotoga sp. HW29]
MSYIVLILLQNLVPSNFSDQNDTNTSSKLLDPVRDKLRVKHYAIQTEQSYVN